MHTQEFMVRDLNSGHECFFFAHSFMSAYQHAAAYIDRNRALCRLKLFRVNNGIGPRWLPVNY